MNRPRRLSPKQRALLEKASSGTLEIRLKTPGQRRPVESLINAGLLKKTTPWNWMPDNGDTYEITATGSVLLQQPSLNG